MPPKAKPKVDNARQERRTEIMQTVGSAMKALSEKKQMDWARENAETIAAGE